MISLRAISKNHYRRSTWKNGLGHTDEIAIFPEGSDLRRGDFLWRLSSAQIDQASAFSIFPHHDRVLVVLSGAGVRLFHRFDESSPEEEMTELPPFSTYEFPGDIHSRCELISGSVQDFSVFIRKGECEAVVDTVELKANDPRPWEPAGRWNFIFVTGSTTVLESPDGSKSRIAPGDSLLVELDSAQEQPFRIYSENGDARVIVVSLQQ